MFNTNIYSQKTSPDLAGNAQKGFSLGQMIKKNQLGNKKREEQAKYKQAFSNYVGGDQKALGEMAKYNPEMVYKMQDMEAQKEMNTQDRELNNSLKRQQLRELQNKRNMPKLSEAQKVYDRESAKELAKFEVGGGVATVNKNKGLLQNAISKLGEEGDIAGGFSTKLPWFGDDKQQDWVNPDMAGVRDDIRSAIQGSLKATLGGQFTEKEAEQMFARAFNPRLSDDENIRRAKSVMFELDGIADNKSAASKYLKENGTLSGFQPPKQKSLPSHYDKKGSKGQIDIMGISSAYAADPVETQNRIKKMSREEKLRLLQGK
jgi:hypothetical protein